MKRIAFDFEEHPDFENFPFKDLKIFEDLESLDLAVCGIDGIAAEKD